jgi:hypothetical protein
VARIYDPFSFSLLFSFSFHFLCSFFFFSSSLSCSAAEMPPLLRPHYYYDYVLIWGRPRWEIPPFHPLLALSSFCTYFFEAMCM